MNNANGAGHGSINGVNGSGHMANGEGKLITAFLWRPC